jgi:hypothetical protein
VIGCDECRIRVGRVCNRNYTCLLSESSRCTRHNHWNLPDLPLQCGCLSHGKCNTAKTVWDCELSPIVDLSLVTWCDCSSDTPYNQRAQSAACSELDAITMLTLPHDFRGFGSHLMTADARRPAVLSIASRSTQNPLSSQSTHRT